MKNKLKSVPNWESISTQYDYVELLKEIKKIAFSDREASNLNPYASTYSALIRFLDCRQRTEGESDADFFSRWNSERDVCVAHGVDFAFRELVEREYSAILEDRDEEKFKEMDKEAIDAINVKDIEEARAITREKFLVQVYLRAISKSRFGRMLEELNNDLSTGFDRYPTTLAEAFGMVSNRRDDPRNVANNLAQLPQGVAFLSSSEKRGKSKKGSGDKKAASGEEDSTRVKKCNHCGKTGHVESQCWVKDPSKRPTKPKQQEAMSLVVKLLGEAGLKISSDGTLIRGAADDETALMCNVSDSIVLTSLKNGKVAEVSESLEKDDILCDSQASISIFGERSLLRDIKQLPEPIYITRV